jgi:hypothetical protein
MKVVSEGPSLVAGVELDARAAGILDELESLLPSHLERGLRGSVADLATHSDLVRVDIQTEFDFDDFLGRSLGLLAYCVLFDMEPTVWRGSRRLLATCHLPVARVALPRGSVIVREKLQTTIVWGRGNPSAPGQ